MKNTKIYKAEDILIFKAHLRSVKISDIKVRMLIRKLKGKNVEHIIALLSVQKVSASFILLKLINSAISNIPNNKRDIKKICIKNLYVDKGRSYKRIFTRSQGRVNYIRKKTSHITIVIKIII